MEKLIFCKNEFSISLLQAKAERVQNVIQSVVNEFTSNGIPIDKVSQLTDLLDQNRVIIPGKLENLVFNQLFPETPKGLNREKYRDLVELPELSSLTESIQGLNGYFGGFKIADQINWEIYTIENGKIKIIPEELEKLKLGFMEVAETAIEKSRLSVAWNVCESLNKLVELASDHPGNYKIEGVAQWNEQSKRFEAAGLFVKNGLIDARMIIGQFAKNQSLKSESVKSNYIAKEGDSEEFRSGEMAKNRNNNSTAKKL